MPIIYGNGFKPLSVGSGEVERKRRDTGEFSKSLLERVGLALGFIGLSFIGVPAEAEVIAEFEEIGVEVAEATVETEAEVAATTANVVRLGQTVKGSTALALGEASGNLGLDIQEGNASPVNEIINFGLSFTPVLGNFKGRRIANIRLLQRADGLIEEQKALLITAETVTDRIEIETRIRQLENIKLSKSSRIFDAEITSDVNAMAKKEILDIIDTNLKNSIDKIKVNNIAVDLRDAMFRNDVRITKSEAKALVKFNTKNIPSVVEGVTLNNILRSKKYNRVVNTLRWLDPNLATRKVWTHAAHFLTSDAPLLKIGDKTIIGFNKINIGVYKKFAKKISKFWRTWGKKIYRASRVKMIPVVSSWIEGYRLVDTGIPGEYIMIVIFKPSKNGRIPQPVIISPVTLETALEFAEGGKYGSVGSFYINRFALARNGAGANVIGGIASVLGPIPLGELRQLLSAPAALERVIKDFAKGDYTQQWLDGIVETTSRLWAHKVGKVLAGRWGIAVARGFQRTSHGHTSLQGNFDFRYLIDEVGVVTLDKARSVQRKAGIQGRTSVINGKRVIGQYQRTVKLMTFGYVKFDGKTGFKKGKGLI